MPAAAPEAHAEPQPVPAVAAEHQADPAPPAHQPEPPKP
jgi:hypothetical protein